jgi:hypothetical protein
LPRASLMVARENSVPACDTLIVAPETEAALSSVTEPERLADEVWAQLIAAVVRNDQRILI